MIHILGSSSSGNCIVIKEKGKIMLDAGLPYNRLAWGAANTDMVLITHCHADHFKAAPELIRRGYEVYMSHGTAHITGTRGANIIKHMALIRTENWNVVPFNTVHDAPEPLGYLIENRHSGFKYLYAIDSAVINYEFTGVTHFLIECNHTEELMDNSNKWLNDRIKKTHMSLDNLKMFLGSSDLSKAKEIWLLHLSDKNSDEKKFVDEIQRLTGVPTYT